TADARYADREVALLLLGEEVDLARRHKLLREVLEILGTQRRVLQRDQFAVHAQRRRPTDLQVDVRSVATDHLLKDRLEVDARGRAGRRRRRRRRGYRRGGISHLDRS